MKNVLKQIGKYLLCVFCSILVINFIVSMASFFSKLDSYFTPSRISKDPTNEGLLSAVEDLEKDINTNIEEIKDVYGENYPTLAIFYYKSIAHYSSVTVIQNFLFSLIAGFGLGNIVYLIFVAKKKTYALTLLLILAFFVTATFLALSDVFTEIANNEQVKFGLPEILWNMEITAIPFVITTLILLACRKIYTVYVEVQNS